MPNQKNEGEGNRTRPGNTTRQPSALPSQVGSKRAARRPSGRSKAARRPSLSAPKRPARAGCAEEDPAIERKRGQ